MLRKELFILAHQCGDTLFYPEYKKLVRSQWRPYDDLKQEQEKQLRHLIEFVYGNVPYYHKLFKGLNLLPMHIQTLDDLEKLPILTRDVIKEHWEEFKPANLSSMKYNNQATGGSTGTPMQYRLSKHDRFIGGAILYRGWGYGGYGLGDKMVFLAGSSLDVGVKPPLVKRVQEIARNIRKLSAMDMGECEMQEYAEVLNSFKPRFIRGYASSIYLFARWLEDTQISVPSPEAVFTTAEKLFPHMRKTIGGVFDCDVYDAYGLNDGGISAFECPEHSGLHIDAERSIMEVVGDDGIAVEQGEGRILATSLYNYALPFIRYSTGDVGSLSGSRCACGRESLLLDDIVGREAEFLITPQGQYVHGHALFGFLFATLESVNFPGIVNKIKEYQVIQKEVDRIFILLVCDEIILDTALDFIRSAIKKRFGWDVEFQFVNAIDRSSAGKYRFIINEVTHG